MGILLLSVVCILLPVLFCLSLLDVSLRSLNYYKIRSIHRHGNAKAQKLFTLLSSPEAAISLILFLRYSSAGLLFITLGAIYYRLPIHPFYRVVIAVATLLLALIVLEYLPRMWATQNPERVAFTLLRPFEVLLTLNRIIPIPRWIEKASSRLLHFWGVSGQKIFSEYSVNEIKMFLSRREKGEDLRKQTIDSKFLDFSARRVREVMVPRPFVKAVEVNTPLKILIKTVQDIGYSRLPVYRSNFDNILGILHVKDVIGAGEPFWLEQRLRKPYFIPETATVQAAFQNMQRNRSHLAIVVDEYGGVDGIVTLEDLIEELIGEIHDEYDEDVEMLHKVSDRVWMLEGNATIKEVNQNLGLDLPENTSYTTVAGFVLSLMDKIPAEKEEIHYGKLLFSVEKMLGYKIARISLHLPQSIEEV